MRTYKSADVNLAAALEQTDALAKWRKRLTALSVVRVERTVTRALMLVRTDWDIELTDGEGWTIIIDTTSVLDAVEIEDLRGELVRRGWAEEACHPTRVRRLLRFLLGPELAASQDRLAAAVTNAPRREVRTGG